MALGNWTAIVIDQDGKSHRGDLTSPLGVTISVYKNWLTIEDKLAWRPTSGYTPTVVGDVFSGRFHYQDVHFVVQRDDYQQSMYFAVWVPAYHDDEQLLAMVGIAAYAYKENDYCGIDAIQQAGLLQMLKENRHYLPQQLLEVSFSEGREFNQGLRYLSEHLGVDLEQEPEDEL